MPTSIRRGTAHAATRQAAPRAPGLAVKHPAKPERWRCDAGDAALADLRVPPDAQRERRFEVACAMTVRLPASPEPSDAWHEMSVQVNGAKQWSRRINTSNPGSWDGLDYRFTHTVPVGQALRVLVQVATRGALRRSLLVEAEEA